MKTSLTPAAILVALAIFTAAPALAQNQPSVPAAAQPADKPVAKVKPAIYDESADAAKVIDAALAKAAKNNRRVLIQWGGNWCGWCHTLHETFAANKELGRELRYEYDVVLIDIGRFDKNMEIAAKYKADLKGTGVPYLTVLDSTGAVLANQETGALEAKGAGKNEYNIPVVMKFLTDHQAPARNAESVLKQSLSTASTEGKRVFLHFGAPWCGWCHKLEGWMERPEVAALLAKGFIDVKIDVDRDTGGKDVLARYNITKDEGIPWFAVLDAEGKALATSHSAQGNIGYPAAPDEIAHFLKMLGTASAKLTKADIEKIGQSLKDNAPKPR